MYKSKAEICIWALIMTTIIFYEMYRLGLCRWNVFTYVRLDFVSTGLMYYLIFMSGALTYMEFYSMQPKWSHAILLSLIPATFFICFCIIIMPRIYIAGVIGVAGKVIIELLHIGDTAEMVKLQRGMQTKHIYISIITKCILQLPIYTALLSLIVFAECCYY